MRPEQPEIARPADRIDRRLRDLVLALARAVRVAVAGQQLVELGVGEADDRQVEVLGQQLLQLAGEQRLVPGAELGQLVVGDAVGPPLRLGQVVEHDHRRLGQPELRRRQDAAVPGDHLAVAGDEHRHRPAELRHRAGDLRDLVGAVGLRVPRIGLQALERPRLDALRSEAQGHGSAPWRRGGWTPGVDSVAGFHWAAVDSVRVQRNPPPEGGNSLSCRQD